MTVGKSGWASSSTSSTGPQMATWQNSGVAIRNATGRLGQRLVEGHVVEGAGGSAVQIGVTPRRVGRGRGVDAGRGWPTGGMARRLGRRSKVDRVERLAVDGELVDAGLGSAVNVNG